MAKSYFDGEGASKFIEIDVLNTRSKDEAKEIGMKIANSILFKASIFGETINWGELHLQLALLILILI